MLLPQKSTTSFSFLSFLSFLPFSSLLCPLNTITYLSHLIKLFPHSYSIYQDYRVMGNCSSVKSKDEYTDSPPPKMASQSAQNPTWKSAQKPISRHLEQNHGRIFANNKAWVAGRIEADPAFFSKLSSPQHPEYL
jgi:hypothetical protein